MISYQKSLDILLKTAPLSPVMTSLEHSLGKVSACDILSAVDLPSSDLSSMDGFALRSADGTRTDSTSERIFEVMGTIAAGYDERQDKSVRKNAGSGDIAQTWEIMTGAPMPMIAGYDCVVKIEDVEIIEKDEAGAPKRISVAQSVPAHSHVRLRGADFQKGDLMIKKGAMITPAHIMAFAASGLTKIACAPEICFSLLSTGKEIIKAGHLKKRGQIYNSNSPFLKAMLAQMGHDKVIDDGAIGDDPALFKRKVKKALKKSDVIISTGAVSMGRYDFIPECLARLGADILFHKTATRPGKPMIFARFANGTHYFGLAGNPMSAVVGLRFFITPFLRHIQGMAVEKPIIIPSIVKRDDEAKNKDKRLFFRKAHLSIDSDGFLKCVFLEGQESFKIKSLLKANCWACLESEIAPQSAKDDKKRGEHIYLYPLTPHQWDIPIS